MSLENELTVEWWETARVVPYDANPRTISEQAVEKTARSIRKYGWRQPIVVDERGVIVVGHTRRLAALKLGLTHVPVHVARGLSPEDARAYRIDDNATGEETDWNYVLLGREVEALRKLQYDTSTLALDVIKQEAALGLASGRGVTGDPRAEWRGMPEYVSGDDGPFRTLLVHFPDPAAVEAFCDLIGQRVNEKTKFVWYPKQPPHAPSSRVYVVEAAPGPEDA